MTIAQITDLHLGHKFERRFDVDTKRNLLCLLDDLGTLGINHIVVTGDIAEPCMIPWFFATIEDRKLSMDLVPGNHDDPKDYADSGQPGEARYFARMMGGYRALFLDTHSSSVDAKQLEWLALSLREADQPLLIFAHHPVLDFDGSYMDTHYPLKNRNEVRELLFTCENDIHLFCGHYHATDERKFRNVRQYITPSLFYQVKKYSSDLEREAGPVGYRIISLHPSISSSVRYLLPR